MKKNSFLWAALSMTAALVMTACSNDDNANESPAQQNAAKTIPYTVTVNGGEGGATTRATVADDPSDATNYHKTLYFADGDKLYVTGTNIKGVLNIQSGMGTASATFSGDLTYSGSGTPASDLSLTATLVSAQQTDGSEVTINSTTGAVTVNYPSTAYCSSVNDAVQKYSNLTGTSTYSTKSFSLTQQTAFLNFVITFEDGTTTGTELSAVVSNNSAPICTANVTTTTESEKVVAKFVLPVAEGTTLSSANVKFGDKAAISFGASKTLEGKVYNVTKTQAAPSYTMAAAATTSDKGKLICTAGHIHVYGEDAACTAGRVAKIIYVGPTGHATYNNGLALALEDMSPNPYTAFTWDNSGANNGGKTAAELCSAWNTSKPVMDAEWLLASKDQWDYMLGTNGAGSYYALRVGFESVDGSNLVEMDYWSSTEYEYDTTKAWSVNLGYECWYENSKDRVYPMVRACLAF